MEEASPPPERRRATWGMEAKASRPNARKHQRARLVRYSANRNLAQGLQAGQSCIQPRKLHYGNDAQAHSSP